jgi:4-amino-4-deoxy-L-arabinose transferase-like glycosyltransferase
MATQSAATTREISRTRTLPWVLISYLALGLAALLPRVLDLGVFLTGDEANFWLRRSDLFMRALRSGDFAATAISTHPGVTTMWLGSAGLLLQDRLLDSGIVRDGSFATFLALTRLPTALVHVAAVLLGYRLLRRLFAPVPAGLAALFWAADPFMIGYSRVLHVDALAGSFATLSLLAACAYWHHERRRADLVLSGVCAGLAILSKSPALAIVPVVGMVGMAAWWRPLVEDRGSRIEDRPFAILDPRSSLWVTLVWGLTAAATAFALWPALWVGPLRAFGQLRLGVEAEGAEPHMLGNFFLGRADDAPGLLFYPVVLALRTTPWTLLGLLALPLAFRRARPATRRDLAALAGFVLLFVVALSVFPKKFNRYLIPAWPAVDILAAVGLVDFGRWILGWLAGKANIRHRTSAVGAVLLAAVALAAVANAAWYHPYGIAYFNQALGGARAGERVFLAGWGEGFEQVATWLNTRPDITGVVTVSPMISSLQPYMLRRAQVAGPDGDALPRKAGYVVVYVRQVQDGQTVPPFDQFYGHAVPLHTVTIHGVDYAWIYQAPPPIGQARPADFGPSLHLRGYDMPGSAQPGQTAPILLAWQVNGQPQADAMLFAHLLGPDGKRYGQLDLPYPISQWRPGSYLSTELPLAVAANAPPGIYRLVVGMYDPATRQRLPLTSADRLDPAIDGPDALLLAELRVE